MAVNGSGDFNKALGAEEFHGVGPDDVRPATFVRTLLQPGGERSVEHDAGLGMIRGTSVLPLLSRVRLRTSLNPEAHLRWLFFVRAIIYLTEVGIRRKVVSLWMRQRPY